MPNLTIMINHGVERIFIISLLTGRVLDSISTQLLPESIDWDDYGTVKSYTFQLLASAV